MIKKIDFKDKKFLNFLKNIESKYFENRSIKNSPWKFKNLKHSVEIIIYLRFDC